MGRDAILIYSVTDLLYGEGCNTDLQCYRPALWGEMQY